MVKKRLLEQDLIDSGFPPEILRTRGGPTGGSCEIYFNTKYTDEQKTQINKIVKKYSDVSDISYRTENPITEMVDYLSNIWNKYNSNK